MMVVLGGGGEWRQAGMREKMGGCQLRFINDGRNCRRIEPRFDPSPMSLWHQYQDLGDRCLRWSSRRYRSCTGSRYRTIQPSWAASYSQTPSQVRERRRWNQKVRHVIQRGGKDARHFPRLRPDVPKLAHSMSCVGRRVECEARLTFGSALRCAHRPTPDYRRPWSDRRRWHE